MKQILSGLFILLSLSFCAQGQDSATVAALKTVVTKLDTLSKKTDSNNANLARLKDDFSQSRMVDSTYLALFIANIDSNLYCHSLINCACCNAKVCKSTSHNCNNENWACDHGWGAWVRFALVMALLLLLWWGSYKYLNTSAMCRDISLDANGKPMQPVSERPYSYSRVQLFWWTMIIISCYTFCFAATGVLIPLNSTAVILLGFSVIVVAGGKMIDQKQVVSNQTGTRSQDGKTEGFFTDILSDENGLSIHRFQTVLFNIIYGIGYVCFFINSFFCTKKYPLMDLSEWQLVLLGISSATYLAMKGTENNKDVSAKTGGNNNPPGGGNGAGNNAANDNAAAAGNPQQ